MKKKNYSWLYSLILMLISCNCAKCDSNTPDIKLSVNERVLQVEGFTGEATSGPIVFINNSTTFISDFSYIPEGEEYFYACTESDWKTGSKFLVEGEDDPKLFNYENRNIFLKATDDRFLKEFDYFGIWSTRSNNFTAYVNIPNEIQIADLNTVIEQDKWFMVLPKCCPYGQVLKKGFGCYEEEHPFIIDFPIYNNNDTHLDNTSIDFNQTQILLFPQPLPCPNNSFYLDKEDKFGILANTSQVVVASLREKLNQSNFCLESVENNESAKIFACYTIHKASSNFYFVFIIVSLVCYFIMALLYLIVIKINKYDQNTHKICFVCYCASMFISFFSLIFLLKLGGNDNVCQSFGFVFEGANLSAFMWIAILCYDMYHIAGTSPKIEPRKLLYFIYIPIVLTILLIYILVSKFAYENQIVPFFNLGNLNESNISCNFTAGTKIEFLVMLGITVVLSIIFLAMTWYKIRQNDKNPDISWKDNKQEVKFLLRAHVITFVIMFMCYVKGCVSLYFKSSGMSTALDYIFGSQGILLVLIFVTNRTGRQIIQKSFNGTESLSRTKKQIEEEEKLSMKSINDYISN